MAKLLLKDSVKRFTELQLLVVKLASETSCWPNSNFANTNLNLNWANSNSNSEQLSKLIVEKKW
ncbi:799_t:CDS:2, partial [Dentiscutata heterogama]